MAVKWIAALRTRRPPVFARFGRRVFSPVVVFLFVEFFDELHYGIAGAVLPALRTELGFSYSQVGLLLGLPQVASTLFEPLIMLLGDTRLRQRLIFAGGLVICVSLLVLASASQYSPILIALVAAYPASGAFVTLSQATLIDSQPGRETHWMARWTASGSLGNLAGPLLVSAGFALSLGWRWSYFLLAAVLIPTLVVVLALRFPTQTNPSSSEGDAEGLRTLVHNFIAELRNRQLLRYEFLLQVADLMLDTLTSYAALYFVDAAGATPAQAGLILTALMLSSLAADMLLIPLLERIPGLRLVRWTAVACIPVYTAFLLVPSLPAKIAMLVAVRFTTLGWYSVLAGEAYATSQGRSGAVNAVGSLASTLGGALVWMVGWAAGYAGLQAAMWLLLLGPASLLLFLPRASASN